MASVPNLDLWAIRRFRLALLLGRQKSFYQWKVSSRKGMLLENELGSAISDSPSALSLVYGSDTHA